MSAHTVAYPFLMKRCICCIKDFTANVIRGDAICVELNAWRSICSLLMSYSPAIPLNRSFFSFALFD
uniref:Secreted protein n=1 Tax=Angiostrongylus cantonensis TaxID=6313 RepID=A0A0K0D7M8_ANGCA